MNSFACATCNAAIVEDAAMISGGRIFCSSCFAHKNKCAHCRMPVDSTSGKRCASLCGTAFCSTCTSLALVCPKCFINVAINDHCYSCGSTDAVSVCSDCMQIASGGKRVEKNGKHYYFCPTCRTDHGSLPNASACPLCKHKTVLPADRASGQRWKIIIGRGSTFCDRMCFYYNCDYHVQGSTYDPCLSP